MKTKLSAIGRIPLNAGLLSSLILLIASIVLSTLSFAQPNWQWAKSAGGILYDGANSVAADSSGNIYVAGVFESASITFGTTTLNNSSTDTTDMFLVKYDAGGNVLWATSAGGTDFDDAASVAADLSGNIFVTGSFSGASITFGSTTLTNTGANADMYIVKYDAGGNVLWAKSAGGNYEDKATCVATDISGNIIVTGYYQAAPITFDSYTLSNSGSYDMFIVKYDASGNALWANRAGGSNDDRGYSVTADASGNVIVAGAFLSSSITIGTTTLNYAGGAYTDIFIVKYDASGNALWANSAGGTYWDEPNSVTTDASGNIFMAGIVYSSSITFGSTTLTNSGSSFYCEMFIVKYDVSGNVQ
ncbi:MAG TPA: SBBP repeat-containing protein, partial [Bacteroidia bacterium]|nr:SBBP repeat-containing protein [Bacteroidia bacterium]